MTGGRRRPPYANRPLSNRPPTDFNGLGLSKRCRRWRPCRATARSNVSQSSDVQSDLQRRRRADRRHRRRLRRLVALPDRAQGALQRALSGADALSAAPTSAGDPADAHRAAGPRGRRRSGRSRQRKVVTVIRLPGGARGQARAGAGRACQSERNTNGIDFRWSPLGMKAATAACLDYSVLAPGEIRLQRRGRRAPRHRSEARRRRPRRRTPSAFRRAAGMERRTARACSPSRPRASTSAP